MKQKVSMQVKTWSITLGVLGSAMVLNGCNGSGGGGLNVKPLPAAIVTATPLATATPVATATVTPVATATVTPVATATPSPTATPVRSAFVGRYVLSYKYTFDLADTFPFEVRQNDSLVAFAELSPTVERGTGNINASTGQFSLTTNENDDLTGSGEFTITFVGTLRKQQGLVTGSGTLRNSFGGTGTFTVVQAQ